MKTFTFDYDEDAVCVDCGENDRLQYNLTGFPNKNRLYLNDYFGSDEIGIWCANCEQETIVISQCERIDLILEGGLD